MCVYLPHQTVTGIGQVIPNPSQPTYLFDLHLMPRLMEQEPEEGHVEIVEVRKLGAVDIDSVRERREPVYPLRQPPYELDPYPYPLKPQWCLRQPRCERSLAGR